MKIHPWFVASVLALSGCASGALYDSQGSAESVYGPFARNNYPWAQSPYADWFAYGPMTPRQGPYYHPYPNLDYYTQYRPIYPG